MRVLVVGAGATGGYFGARLAQAGRDVTFLLRPRRAEVVRERGLRLTGEDPDEVVPVQVVTADQIDSTFDVVLVTVKGFSLRAAIDNLTPGVGTGTRIIPFLNGMFHMPILNDRFGSSSVLGGVVKVATTLNDDGDIVRLAPFAALTIGAQAGTDPGDLGELAQEFSVEGYQFDVSGDIEAEMWAKWVMISTIGGFTCLLRGAVGEIVAVPGGREIGVELLHETAAVAAAAGYEVPRPALAAAEAMITEEDSALTSSMYRDLVSGQATEGEFLLGDLYDRARALGVDTPVLRLAATQLRVYERRRG